MSREININRQLLGLEDILFGTGTVEQTRGGQLATVTKVNAGNLPFDETQNLLEWAQSVNLEQLGNIITELQAIYDNLASISNVDDNLSLLNNIISNITVLQELHTNLSILQNVNSNITIITDVNTNLDILTSIYNNLSALVNIHTNLPELLSINTNIVPNITEILDVNNKAEQVALDKQVVESLASQVTIDKQDINTMKLAVETIYDTFDDRFLGAKDIDPLVDNDGNALLDGALYFNTLSNALKVYALDITTWVTIPRIYLSSLLDVQLTSITTNSILTWNGTKWVNTTTPVFDSVKLAGTNYGVMSWNPDEQVPSITLNSDVDIDLGESLILVKNTTGSTILDGKVVMVVGSNGNSGNILVSLHSGLKADAKRTIGIATQNILNNSMGFVTKEGKVKGINTTGSIYGETWVDGEILYVKANGALTKVEPLDSQLKMPIAFVIHAHTHGTLYVRTLGIDENHDRDLISTKLDTSEYTATDILTKLKTVDGSGSGLEAETATKLSTARTIALTGDVTGNVNFDGSANVSIITTVVDDSHNHVISNVDGLQAALNAKVEVIGNQNIEGIKTFSSSPIVPTPTAGTQVANKEYVDSQIANRKTIFTGVYGLDWNETTDTYTRTGSDNYLAIQSLIRRCVLNANGTVNYYLNPDNSNFKADGTPSKLDGTDGNVMVEVPKFYYKYEYVTSNGNIIHRHSISLTPEVGYEVYWSHMHPTEKAYRYYPAYQGYNSGGVLKSISGVYPTTNQSIVTFRSQATANGSGWHQIDFALHEALTLLCIIEHGTMNIQSALGQGRTMLTGGTWSGGSLIGITGLSNSLGNKSGNYTFAGSADAPEADLSFMSYRGCENFFGNVWRFADGINATGANSKTIYVNNNPATYASDVFTGDYYSTGVVTAGTSGYVRKLGNSNKGFFPTDVTGGASNIGTTDYYYTSATVNTIAWVGGSAGHALTVGPLYLAVSGASSLVYVYVGSGVAR